MSMSVLDSVLLRLGLVRIKRYGLSFTPDGRLVTEPETSNAEWSTPFLPPAAPVDLLRPNQKPQLAQGSTPPPLTPSKRRSASMAVPQETEPAATEPTAAETAATHPAMQAEEIVAAARPERLARGTAAPAITEDSVDQEAELSEEEWEWKLAMARAKAGTADTQPLAKGSGPVEKSDRHDTDADPAKPLPTLPR